MKQISVAFMKRKLAFERMLYRKKVKGTADRSNQLTLGDWI